MKTLVDNKLPVSEFGKRIFQRNIRYYYRVVGYDCLVLVCWGDDYVGWNGRVAVALFDFDTVRGDIICQQFPKAPASWQNNPDLIQCTIRPVNRLPKGDYRPFSQVIHEMIGPGC